MIASVVLALLAGAPALPARGGARVPDRVELADGAKLEGRVVFEDAHSLVLRTGSREREIDKKDVKRSDSRAARQRKAIERWIALRPSDLPGVVALAQDC